ncbi:MAG: hypothetical protein QOH72_3826 [Solirubrobacteraceae bacterium]|jgi:hypothetical protein|nr:hypothetical protein [Solirubrobacteraceae bacterium]
MATSSFADPTIASAPPTRLRRRGVIAALAGAAVVLAALVAVLALRPHGTDAPSRFRSADQRFSLVLPHGWRALRGAELHAVRSAPVAVLRRTDGRGVVVVHERPALASSSRSLTRDLSRQVARRFRGVQPVSARTVALPGGPAYVYTFARPAAGRVQSIAVAPRGGRTYTLDAVAGSGARDVAAQVGAILRSFDTTNPAPRS